MSTQNYIYALEEFAGKDFKVKLDQMHFVMDNLLSPTSLVDERIKQAYLLSYSMGLEVVIRTLLSKEPEKTFAKETAKINQIYDSYLSSVNFYNSDGVISIEFGYKRIGNKQTHYKPYDWTNTFTVNPESLTNDVKQSIITAVLVAHTERPYFLEGAINIVKKIIDPNISKSEQLSTKTSENEILIKFKNFFEDTNCTRSVMLNRRTIYFNSVKENSISFIFKGNLK